MGGQDKRAAHCTHSYVLSLTVCAEPHNKPLARNNKSYKRPSCPLEYNNVGGGRTNINEKKSIHKKWSIILHNAVTIFQVYSPKCLSFLCSSMDVQCPLDRLFSLLRSELMRLAAFSSPRYTLMRAHATDDASLWWLVISQSSWKWADRIFGMIWYIFFLKSCLIYIQKRGTFRIWVVPDVVPACSGADELLMIDWAQCEAS